MQRLKTSLWGAFEPHRPVAEVVLRFAAAALAAASAALTRLAQAIGEPAAAVQAQSEPRFEFHTDAGAPEGALYLDGKLVGWLSGVTRL